MRGAIHRTINGS